jgi:hypothetical protein
VAVNLKSQTTDKTQKNALLLGSVDKAFHLIFNVGECAHRESLRGNVEGGRA